MLRKMIEMLTSNRTLDGSVSDETIREIMLADADIFGLEKKEETCSDDYLRIVYYERIIDDRRTDVYFPSGLNPGSLTFAGYRLNHHGNNHNGNCNGGYQK